MHEAGDWLAKLYSDLHRQAAKHMRRERAGHTLQPTALISEAYLRLSRSGSAACRSRTRFFIAAASVFRRVLVDHARARRALKRGGRQAALALQTPDELSAATGPSLDVLALDELLTKLRGLDDRSAQVVELKFFAGLTHAQIAAALDVSTSAVDSEWRFARAWLLERLADQGPSPR